MFDKKEGENEVVVAASRRPLAALTTFLFDSLPSGAARPPLAPSPAHRAAAARAEASLQESKGMFLLFSAEPENSFGRIQ